MDKLVRDKIEKIARTRDPKAKIHVIRVILDEKRAYLIDKVKEELQEFEDDRNIEELADLLETVRGLAYHHGFKWDDVEQVRLGKYIARGGFEQGLVLRSPIKKYEDRKKRS